MSMQRWVMHEYICQYCERLYAVDVVLQETENILVQHRNGVCQTDLKYIRQEGLDALLQELANERR